MRLRKFACGVHGLGTLVVLALLSVPGAPVKAQKAQDEKDAVPPTPAQRYAAVAPMIRGEQPPKAAQGYEAHELDRWKSLALNYGRVGLLTPARPFVSEFVHDWTGTWELESRYMRGRPAHVSAIIVGEAPRVAPSAMRATGALINLESGIADSFSATEFADNQAFSMGAFVEYSAEALYESDPVVRVDLRGKIVGSYGAFREGVDIHYVLEYQKFGSEYVLIKEIPMPTGTEESRSIDEKNARSALEAGVFGPRHMLLKSFTSDAVDVYYKSGMEANLTGLAGPRDFWKMLEKSDFKSLRNATCDVNNLYTCLSQR